MVDVGELAEGGLGLGGLFLIELGRQELRGRRVIVIRRIATVPHTHDESASLVDIAVERAPILVAQLIHIQEEHAGVVLQLLPFGAAEV